MNRENLGKTYVIENKIVGLTTSGPGSGKKKGKK
jgi:hypothetical protein